jgi:hypothetical protein
MQAAPPGPQDREIGMRLVQAIGWLGIALVSGAIGWGLRSPGPAPVRAEAPLRLAAAPAVAQGPVFNTPLIAVAGDGKVTLHVDQQPLEWVLEQIAQQSGWADVKARAAGPVAAREPSPAGAAPACAEPPRAVPLELALRALQGGSEAERAQGLLQIRNDGATVPDEMLKQLFETDASDSVRLLAFDSYLEPRSGDSLALRTALQAALYVPSGAIQREAKRRLEELVESERIDAAHPQADRP